MRHRRMLAPINTIKHYVQLENLVVTAGTARVDSLVDAVNIISTPDDVIEGSIVKAVYIEVWIKSNISTGNDAKFQLVIEKLVANSTPITFTQMNNLASYGNKKNILFVSQGVLGDQTTNSVAVVRNWFLIPKGKQRFGLGDNFSIAVSATTGDLNRCGFATYKEYK